MADSKTKAGTEVDPRLRPHTTHWVRYGNRVKQVSSLSLPRLLQEGWEEVEGANGRPLPHVPGLPDGVHHDEPAEPAPTARPAITSTSTTSKQGGDA